MLPTFPNFKKLELSDRADIKAITSKYPPYSDFNFVSMWSWDVKGEMRISELNGNLVVRFNDYITGEPFYSFLGVSSIIETADALIKYSISDGLKPILKLIPEISILESPKRFLIEYDRDNSDYVYDINEICKLQGKKYLTKRNLINRFKKRTGEPDVRILDLNNSNSRMQILSLLTIWRTNKFDNHKDVDIENEYRAIEKLFHANESLNLFSVGIYRADLLIGFAILEIVNDGYAIAHFTKADTSFVGIYDIFLHKICGLLTEKECNKLNYEQDLGLEPLRRSKNSYRPMFFLKKYVLNERY